MADANKIAALEAAIAGDGVYGKKGKKFSKKMLHMMLARAKGEVPGPSGGKRKKGKKAKKTTTKKATAKVAKKASSKTRKSSGKVVLSPSARAAYEKAAYLIGFDRASMSLGKRKPSADDIGTAERSANLLISMGYQEPGHFLLGLIARLKKGGAKLTPSEIESMVASKRTSKKRAKKTSKKTTRKVAKKTTKKVAKKTATKKAAKKTRRKSSKKTAAVTKSVIRVLGRHVSKPPKGDMTKRRAKKTVVHVAITADDIIAMSKNYHMKKLICGGRGK